MVCFAGKFVYKTPSWLQLRFLQIPWTERSRRFCCLNDKANYSSFPVRYVPKKSLKIEKPQDGSAHMKSLDKQVIKKRLDPNSSRFEVANDQEVSQSSFILDKKLQNLNQVSMHKLTYDSYQEANEEINYDVETMDDECIEEPEEDMKEPGIHLEKNTIDQGLQAYRAKEDAEKTAIELLATRAYTVVELRKKLQGKRFFCDTIDDVIMDFQSRGLINDCLYAETFARSRWSSLSWGPRRIKQALLKKGVIESDAEKALKLVFQDGDSDGDKESTIGLSKVSMDHLYVQASKQWLRGRDVTNETRKSRIIRWLQYRGFNWGVISFILKKLESQRPP